jgi:hypothetical protein
MIDQSILASVMFANFLTGVWVYGAYRLGKTNRYDVKTWFCLVIPPFAMSLAFW